MWLLPLSRNGRAGGKGWGRQRYGWSSGRFGFGLGFWFGVGVGYRWRRGRRVDFFPIVFVVLVFEHLGELERWLLLL